MKNEFKNVFTLKNDKNEIIELLVLSAMGTMDAKESNEFTKKYSKTKKIVIEIKINGHDVSMRKFVDRMLKQMDTTARNIAVETYAEKLQPFHDVVDKMIETSDVVNRNMKEVLNLLGEDEC